MVLKNVFTVIVCTTLLAWPGLAMAGEYRPDQFLGLDLSKAVLSPKRLGPPAEFAPVPVEAKADRGGEAARARKRSTLPKFRAANLRSDKPHAVAHDQACPSPRQSARCPGVRYADSGLALQVGRHLRLEAVAN